MHRNSQKRIIEPNKIYFITTVTQGRFPYFENEILAWLFVAQLKLTKILKGFKLIAFCILYDHVHLMLQPRDEKENISRIMQHLKRHYARNVNLVMNYQDTPDNEGDICKCRLLGEYELSSKMNKYVKNLKTKYSQSKSQLLFKWQKSFHDHLIRNEKDFYAHYDYTVENYKKHAEKYHYPENYKFTSLNFEDMIDNISR